jgi:hypothetical protein
LVKPQNPAAGEYAERRSLDAADSVILGNCAMGSVGITTTPVSKIDSEQTAKIGCSREKRIAATRFRRLPVSSTPWSPIITWWGTHNAVV